MEPCLCAPDKCRTLYSRGRSMGLQGPLGSWVLALGELCPLLPWWLIFFPTLGLPLAIIATLQVLQHLSGHESGIVTVSDPGSIIQDISTRWLPALVMLITAAFYSSLDFSISVLWPYHALKKGNTTASRSLMSTLIGKQPLHALYTAQKHHYWAAIFSISAALIGSILTVISSGLYVIDTAPTSQQVQLLRIDSFNTDWQNSATSDNSSATLVGLTESLNLTYSPFTYGELPSQPWLYTVASLPRILARTKPRCEFDCQL